MVQKLEAEGSIVDREVMVQRHTVVFAILEGTVLDQFGIDATIARVVDILIESQLLVF